MKRLLGYLLYMLFIVIFVYWGVRYGQYVKIQGERMISGLYSIYVLYAFIAFYPVIMGMILAVPQLIQHIRQEGKWKIDWQILLAIVLPTFLYNIQPLMSWLVQSPFFNYNWNRLMANDIRAYDISGIVCGYFLLSSLKRSTLTKEKDITSGEVNY